jgi:hypothetical protein
MKDLLKYGLIASAGQPRSLTGEALIGLGALLSQMDFDFSKDEEKKSIDEEPQDFNYVEGDEKEGVTDVEALTNQLKGGFREFQLSKANNAGKVIQNDLPNRPPPPPIDPPPLIDPFVPTEGTGRDAVTSADFSIENILGYNPNYSFTPLATGEDDQIFNLENSGFSQTLKGIRNFFGRFGQGDKYYTSGLNRLKPEVLEILDKARYKNKGKDDTPLHRIAHVTNSPYLRTDNVDYRQMRQATAPGYTGEIGKAAIEGYNLVIDKYNYDQAVKADYEEELEDQMGSLNVEADFLTDQARQDYLELSMGKKKRLNEAFNSYANGDISKLDYENVKANLVSELQAAAATRTNITNSIKDFIENKGTIDVGASDREMLDFLMTGEKSPERISIKNIDGIDYVTGTTRGGRDFQVPTSKIANGTAGFRVVKKANLAPVISGALKNINAYTSTVKTDLGFGVSTPSPEKAREIGIASIRNTLGSNEADLRSIMSQIYGVDHTAYQNFLGSDPTANKSAMLDDAAEHLYDTQVAEKYFPMTRTTRFKSEKTGSTTQGEREVARIKALFDSKGNITENNYKEFLTLVPGFEKNYRSIIKDGKLQIGKGKDLVADIDLSNPTLAKQQLANLAGVTGYQAGQVQNKLTEEQIKARASQFLSNAGL